MEIPLNKEVCIRCRNNIKTIYTDVQDHWDWGEQSEIDWKDGVVACPMKGLLNTTPDMDFLICHFQFL